MASNNRSTADFDNDNKSLELQLEKDYLCNNELENYGIDKGIDDLPRLRSSDNHEPE
jgi:hypothetical protein